MIYIIIQASSNDIDYRHESWDIDGEDVVRELPLELEIYYG